MNWPEVFIVGSIWFWLLVVGEILLIFFLLEWDQGAIATLTLAASLLALQLLGDVDIYGYVIHHPWTIVLGAVGYFAAGTGWAIVKWWFYVREQRGWYDELRAAFLRTQGFESAGSMPPELQHPWQQCVVSARRERRKLDVNPLATGHKARILRWMSYWPWSATWTLLKDPVRKAFLSIYYQIAQHLQQMSDKAFHGVEADLPKEDPGKASLLPDPVLVEFGVADLVAQNKHGAEKSPSAMG
jgi:hypothetical protein